MLKRLKVENTELCKEGERKKKKKVYLKKKLVLKTLFSKKGRIKFFIIIVLYISFII